MNFYDNLQEICKKNGTTVTAVLKKADIASGAIGNWKKGSTPNGETLVKIAKAAGTTTDCLLTGEEPVLLKPEFNNEIFRLLLDSNDMEQLDIAKIIEYYKNIPENNRQLAISKFKQYLPKQTVKCSIHNASAGTGFSFYDNSDDFEDINIIDTDIAKRANFAIRVEGNSMLPLYRDNDIVLIQRTDIINIGQIGIFIADNDKGFIKKLGKKELISVNPDYKNIPLNENIRCIGLVLGSATEI